MRECLGHLDPQAGDILGRQKARRHNHFVGAGAWVDLGWVCGTDTKQTGEYRNRHQTKNQPEE